MNKIICLMGDLHLGLQKDSEIFHKISLDYAKWVKQECEKRNCEEIWQAGDIMHSRKQISLPTLQCANDFFNILSDFKIRVIYGNHDLYHDHTREISSISIISNKKNITLYSEPTFDDDYKAFFAPWGTTIEEIPAGNRILIGHADVQSFQYGNGAISNHGFKGKDLADKSELTLLGHYHKVQERTYGKHKLMYLGSCFQHDFGERHNTPQLFFLNTETLQIESVENTVSPRFKYIRHESDIKDIKGNFVAVISDDQSLKDKVINQQPIFLKVEILDEVKRVELSEDSVKEFKVVDIGEEMETFTNGINFKDWKLEDDDKQKVTKQLISLYDEMK